ncbi:glycosyltransferase family 10 domain-containing protein [Leisingera aquimarina]|uniref:glycosyltransferase family 10 domain-containing protein n=1 Tax=Leisingera aquimarina TaxID=476529 RepID=UPI0012EB3D58|nr:glycosyltransferase family 10 [Leisingera aquimarina]
MIRIFKTGAHIRRTPLSYPALAPLFDGHIQEAETPGEADLYVFAHILDIENAPRELVEDWRQRRRPIVLLSEEPFWDTLWGRQPLARRRLADNPWGRLPVHQLTHHSSAIFRFTRIPYYLLTNHRFANAYAAKFARNARLTPADWRQAFLQRRSHLAFLFERRDGAHHSLRWPEGDITGLCHWRTQVAQACRQGCIERLGRSWQPERPARGQLADWHLDKLALLDGRARVVGAFENTHQPDYITEKLFDAFACGALPAYTAGPRHRIHELGLPAASWLNLHGLSATRAAARLDGLDWGDAAWLERTSEAYAAAQRQLAALLGDPRNWLLERQRLQAALLAEFRSILDQSSSAWPDPAAA